MGRLRKALAAVLAGRPRSRRTPAARRPSREELMEHIRRGLRTGR